MSLVIAIIINLTNLKRSHFASNANLGAKDRTKQECSIYMLQDFMSRVVHSLSNFLHLGRKEVHL
jgi:hypothetical protein